MESIRKRRKIEYQQHPFPAEIWREIFQYVPELFDVAAVCQQFYEIVCEIESGDHMLIIKRSKETKVRFYWNKYGL